MFFCSVVGRGGVLFEYFLLLHAAEVDVKVLETALTEKKEIDPEFKESLCETYSLTFWYEAIRIMHELNQKCTGPLMLWHMLLEYRGLSLTGQRIGAAVGGTLPHSTYERKKKALIKDY